MTSSSSSEPLTASTSSFSVPSTPNTSRPSSPIASTSASLLTHGHVRLPTKLPRPPQCECTVDASTLDLDPELRDISLCYIIEQLRTMGNDLLLATAQSLVEVPARSASGAEPLPSHLAITMPPTGILSPSHVLAVHGQDVGDVLLLPAHGLLYALGCAALPHLARSRPAADGSGYLPVAHLHVPSTNAFPLLAAYLTCHSPSSLLARLLPADIQSLEDGEMTSPALLAQHFAHATSHEDLGKHLHLTHGLWADLCVLGVGDDALWANLQLAWGVILGALAIRTAKMQGDRAPAATTTGEAAAAAPAAAL